MKYVKTKYPNITSYETKNGTRYRIRKKYRMKNYANVVDESGFKTLAHAKARLREIEDDLDKSEVGYFRNKNLTVEEYFAEYSKRKSAHQWSADSKKSNISLFKNHIKPYFGNIPLSKLTRSNYEEFINKKLLQLRKRSVLTIHRMFMAMLNDAVYDGVIERNRLQRVEIADSSIPPKNKRVSLHDYTIWMDMAEKLLTKYEFSIVTLCVYGLRRGEVCGLRESVVSYDDHPNLATVHIADTRTQATAIYGKGGVKTPTSDRYIVLDEKGTEALQYVIKESKEIKKDFGKILHRDDFLLPNPATGEPFDPGQLNRLFDKVSEASGIKISPHMLRHFFATQAAIAGVNKEHVAAYLGHSDKTMTEYYTHIKDETASNVIDIVSKRLQDAEKLV